MSTVAEIESAIEKLPPGEFHRLLNRLLVKSTNEIIKPKTGEELARLWTERFHLSAAEADSLGSDLDEARRKQSIVRSSEWD